MLPAFATNERELWRRNKTEQYLHVQPIAGKPGSGWLAPFCA
jgi:hypothetical protein